jgi:hypothetical protein
VVEMQLATAKSALPPSQLMLLSASLPRQGEGPLRDNSQAQRYPTNLSPKEEGRLLKRQFTTTGILYPQTVSRLSQLKRGGNLKETIK